MLTILWWMKLMSSVTSQRTSMGGEMTRACRCKCLWLAVMVRFILGKLWVVKKNLRPVKVGITVKCLFNLIRCSVTRMLRWFRVIIGTVS